MPPHSGLVPDQDAVRYFLAEIVQYSILLTAIPANGGSTSSCWFGEDSASASEWACALNTTGHNLYWTVNVARGPINRKPAKSDISLGRFVQVDKDPPADGAPWDMDVSLTKIEALSPSFVVASGNGYQAFWRLPVPSAELSEVEGISRAVACLIGGDNCHNIDRLMRLPGSINYPNAKKCSAGRTAVMARLLHPERPNRYSLHELKERFPTPPQAVQASRGLSNECYIPLRANELDPPATGHLATLIDNPTGIDRSADVAACAFEMTRAGYSDSQVLGILMNPQNAVHDHIRDQNLPERAARRALSFALVGRDPTAAFARTPVLPPNLFETATNSSEAPPLVRATPYTWRDPLQIPPRQLVYGRSLLRGSLSMLTAPGASGKTAFTVGIALSLATGKPLLDQAVWRGPKKVWIWNLEDSTEELSRLIQAAAKFWNLTSADLGSRLLVDSAMDGAALCLAAVVRQNAQLDNAFIGALSNELLLNSIDVLIIDPFVSSHRVPENDNGSIDMVAKALARVASKAGCSILVVHHTRKLGREENTSESARGAGALVNAARSVVTINRMTENEADKFGIERELRGRYFRAYDDKNNRAPRAEKNDWFFLQSVDLGNSRSDYPSDSMPVVTPWAPPTTDADAEFTAEEVGLVQTAIRLSDWRQSVQSPQWAGFAVAKALRLESSTKPDKQKLQLILGRLLKKGFLKIENRPDKARRPRPCVIVDETAELPTPVQGGAEQGGATNS